MRLQFRRRNLPWLVVLGAMTGIGLLSGAASPIVAAALAGMYGTAVLGSMLNVSSRRVTELSRSSLTAMRMSTNAREAFERARRRGGMIDPGLTLLDVGLITVQTGRAGMDLAMTRDVSQDEDGVRPFIQLHVQPVLADREARIRFELIDGNGARQYVHEMRTYLREGEMNLLADQQLPLAKNPKIAAGDWDLRVFVDGSMIGALSFTLIPSLSDRFRQPGTDVQGAASRLADEITDEESQSLPADDRPMSLEELLRQRGNRPPQNP